MPASLTGDKALDKTLRRLRDKTAKRIARKAVSQALTVINRAAKREAPDKTTRRSIGKRMKRSSGLVVTAKVGVNVGKKKSQASHVARWIALGTKIRKTKRGQARGAIKGDDFLARSFKGSEGAARSKMQQVVAAEIAKGAK